MARPLGYGNADTRGGVDHFWLDGALRTSALDQVRFLARLATVSLRASERSQRIVSRMLVQEANDCYTLFAKTGLVGVAAQREIAPAERVGWYVGWVRRGRDMWAFALNLDVRQPDHAGRRGPIANELLARTGVIPRRTRGRPDFNTWRRFDAEGKPRRVENVLPGPQVPRPELLSNVTTHPRAAVSRSGRATCV